MSWLLGARARLRSLFRHAAEDARTREEFEFHLDMETSRQLARGLSAGEARRAALVAFGGVEGHREHMHRGRTLGVLEDFCHELRHAVRALARAPGFSFVALLTLGLGIGLTAGMFSVVYSILLREAPFDGADRYRYVYHMAGGEWVPLRIHEYEFYVREQRSFDALAGVLNTHVTLSGDAAAERVAAARVSANLFGMLGVAPQRGRTFTAAEERGQGERVVMLGYDLWRNRYGSDAEIIGKQIRVNGVPATVVGLMPPGLAFPTREQLWLPLEADARTTPRGEGPTLGLIGRLRHGVSAEQAHAELVVLSARLQGDVSTERARYEPVVRPFTDYVLGSQPRALLYTMFGAVFFVLLVACTNAANLLLARAIVRQKELGVRSALGASRLRIIAQFLHETWVLCGAGAVLGMVIAFLIVRLFNAALLLRIPSWMEMRLDVPLVLFTIALTVFAALLAGLLPALQAARADARGVLTDEGRGATSFRIGRASRALVTFEVALSCALLVAAGLTTRSIMTLRAVDLGFDDRNLLTAAVSLPDQTYPDTALPSFHARLEERLRAVAGFSSVALASSLPGLGAGGMPLRVAIEGEAYARLEDRPRAPWLAVAPSYLRTLGVQVAAGRDFTERDLAEAEPVALVTPAFAARFFPDVSAVGRRIRVTDDRGTETLRTIVGVTPDIRVEELAEAGQGRDFILLPLAQQQTARWVNIIARTRGAPLSAASDLRAAVADVDRDLPVLSLQTLRAAIEADTWFMYLFGGLFALFGAAALVLAVVGLYGVLAFSVSQRTREYGIRMAIGATAVTVRAMVLRHGMLQVSIGMVAGLALAALLSRLLAIILFDVRPGDPLIFGLVIGALLFTALGACLIPAWRATRIELVRALTG